MPIIERKTLDRVNTEDVLYLDAGNLMKAGQKVGEKISSLAKYNVSHITVIAPTREERAALNDDKLKEHISNYIEIGKRKSHDDLRFNLKNTLLNFHELYSEKDRIFSIPGKRSYLETGDLLSAKIESLNYNHVQAGSFRLIDKYKLKYIGEIITKYQSFYDKLKPIEKGEKESKGAVNRIHMNSIRLNSMYDDSKLASLGDSLVNQSIDIALLFLHTFININKKRIIEGRPLSESRWDPSQKKSNQGIYQYKPELIFEAVIGALLHNVGEAHSLVHQIISGKPYFSDQSKNDQMKIKQIQKSTNVLKHLLDRDDISSITRMIAVMQKDYPDGTGYPSPNENRYLFEFVRLFQIIEFYDHMTNPVLSKTVFSRMDVINYIKENSGVYNYSGDKFVPQKKFDSMLVDEFLDILAPYEINEKVYLYEKKKRNHPMYVGKVVSYPDSYFPMVAILKDEKNNRAYRDGTVFMHIPSSTLFIKSKDGKIEKKKNTWISNLEIFDKNLNAGDILEYRDMIFGSERPLSKHL